MFIGGFFSSFFYLCVSHFLLSIARNNLSLFDKMKQQDLHTTTGCSCRLTPLPHMLWPSRLHSNQTKRYHVWSLRAVPDLPSCESKRKTKTFICDLRICYVFCKRNWLPHPHPPHLHAPRPSPNPSSTTCPPPPPSTTHTPHPQPSPSSTLIYTYLYKWSYSCWCYFVGKD